MRSLRPSQLLVVFAAAVLLTIAFTWPLVPRMGEVGRVNTGDGRWSLWVVSWVAHALTDRRAQVMDANIFHPERGTLTYSEGNFVAGLLAVPVWLLTRNPYAAHNAVVAVAFAAGFVGAFALAWQLTRRFGPSMLAGLLYGFNPYVFGHTAHIQLLLTAGIPVALLFVHRLVDAPRVAPALLLGLTLSIQALACAYYGILGGLMVGVGVVWFAVTRGRWREPRWWGLVGLAAGVAIATALPFFLPYIEHRASSGFGRSLGEAARYAATWRDWLASAAWPYRPLLPSLVPVSELLFPGVAAVAAAAYGAWTALGTWGRASAVRAQAETAAAPLRGDAACFYVAIVVLVGWASFGPAGGLYTVLFETIPLFGFLRAPGRFGIGVLLAIAVLAAAGAAALQDRFPRRRLLVPLLGIVMAAELFPAPLALPDAPRVPAVYRLLAQLPRGPVVEIPFYENPIDFHRHTYYMLHSTAHWRRLVNGYSDYASPTWIRHARTLRHLPHPESIALLRELRVRYVVVHGNLFSRRERETVLQRFQEHAPHFRLHAVAEDVWLYEVVP